MWSYVHQQLAVSFAEYKVMLRKKKFYLFGRVGPPWRVGPVDLVTPVSMVVSSMETSRNQKLLPTDNILALIAL